ncbi:dihydrofolate reductase family protein [Arthrobacter globiformis]|uniref:dihydrofolate reductase family protein n=1 Tax=Arthrobacter globiformis TaxID=1665 RepID=UPI000B409D5E|nr:dihydrofolate reductase family protein [Arthrobacter globiformis]
MARLIYSGLISVDGYMADREGNFDWAEPDAEVHSFINGLQRTVGTYLFGRRMYEVLAVWEHPESFGEVPAYIRDFAEQWQAADKVVYSRTLQDVSTARTRIEREFSADAVARLKEQAGRDLAIGGPEMAAEAIRAGLVDEFQMFLTPVAVGGGKRFLPDDVRLGLELLEERRFGNGTVFLRYANRAG